MPDHCTKCGHSEGKFPLGMRFRLWRLNRLLKTMNLQVDVSNERFRLYVWHDSRVYYVPERFFARKVHPEQKADAAVAVKQALPIPDNSTCIIG